MATHDKFFEGLGDGLNEFEKTGAKWSDRVGETVKRVAGKVSAVGPKKYLADKARGLGEKAKAGGRWIAANKGKAAAGAAVGAAAGYGGYRLYKDMKKRKNKK